MKLTVPVYSSVQICGARSVPNNGNNEIEKTLINQPHPATW